ncbi:MAG: hypothetical protein EOP92_43810 [Lysobacteraceae bacterium]|nr:MAG: hypothetical protein EOP92_43810 [Xanthomonadaceae bacterium]
MARTILGILIGALAATLALVGAAYAFAEIHRWPGPAEWAEADLLADFTHAMPLPALACLLGGLALAALVGGALAARIANPHRGGAALVIGALLTSAVIFQATLFAQPEWLVVAGMLLPMPFATLAAWLAMPRAGFETRPA